MNVFLESLKKVARSIEADKPKLHFLGLVHRDEAPADRWDLLVSSDQLEPWSMKALDYVVDRLKKELAPEALIQIARVVVLPRNHKVIASLAHSHIVRHGELDGFDRTIVIWPELHVSAALSA